MSKHMVDFRCPKCNSAVKGKAEVAHVKTLPASETKCGHCKTSIYLTSSDDGGLGRTYFYSSTNRN